MRVELNHSDTSCLPASLVDGSNDHRILAVARNLAAEGRAFVTVVTKDLPLRLKASIVGLDADEYRNELASDSSWTGFTELDADPSDVDTLFAERVLDLAEARDLPCNIGFGATTSPRASTASRSGASTGPRLPPPRRSMNQPGFSVTVSSTAREGQLAELSGDRRLSSLKKNRRCCPFECRRSRIRHCVADT